MLLHSIRERATGWFAWVIVILISIPFALWGINSYITPNANPAVANVGDYKVSVQEFQNAVQNESKKYQGQIDEALIKQIVLEKLISKRAMINYLAGMGQTISKQQIDKAIRNDESFLLDGQFSEELYNRYLPNAYSKSNYRSNIATQLLLQQFSDGISQSSIVSDQEVQRVIQLVNQKRDISYAVIQADNYKDEVAVSDEEITNYYQNFQNQFENPEQIKLAYLEISRNEMAKNTPVTDEQLEKYYKDNLSQYTQPERRKASHILFTFSTDADNTAKEKVKAEAQAVLDKIKSGADFSEMAKEYSRDPGSADKGGDLGFFGTGEMVPAFEESAYALKTGDVSDLVESPFGYHIIKLVAIEGGESKSFDEVKDKITEAVQFELTENIYFEKAETMQTLAYEQPDSLEAVAAELAMTIKESELMSRSGSEGIFNNEKLLNAAFSESVLEEGNNSDLIELGDDHVVIVRIIERIPANIKPLDEVKDKIQTRLKQDGITIKAQQKANELIEELDAGQSIADITEANSLKLENTGLVARQAMSVPRYILAKAFTMPRETKYASTKTDTGDIALVAVNTIEEGDSDDKVLFKDIKTALLQNKANINTALSVLQIRSESQIKINQRLLSEQDQ